MSLPFSLYQNTSAYTVWEQIFHQVITKTIIHLRDILVRHSADGLSRRLLIPDPFPVDDLAARHASTSHLRPFYRSPRTHIISATTSPVSPRMLYTVLRVVAATAFTLGRLEGDCLNVLANICAVSATDLLAFL